MAACIASLYHFPLFQSHPSLRQPKACTLGLNFRVIFTETKTSGHARKKQSGRAVWISPPTLLRARSMRRDLKKLTPPRSSPPGGARLPGRRRCGLAGCFSLVIGPGVPRRRRPCSCCCSCSARSCCCSWSLWPCSPQSPAERPPWRKRRHASSWRCGDGCRARC